MAGSRFCSSSVLISTNLCSCHCSSSILHIVRCLNCLSVYH